MKKLMLTLSSLALVAALAGCGSSSGGSASGSPTLAPEDKGVKFAQCMRKNGIQMEDPQPGQVGTMALQGGDKPKMEAALKACEAFRPVRSGDGKMSAKDFDQLTKLAQCMRRNGIQVPDPKQNGEFVVPADKAGDAKAKKAREICHAEVGIKGPGTVGKAAVPGSAG